MRSANEIVIACQEQQPANEQELRLCCIALSAMLGQLERQARDLAQAVIDRSPSAGLRASFFQRDDEIRFLSRKTPVDAYLGADHTPGTPENDRLRQMAKAIFKKATGKDL